MVTDIENARDSVGKRVLCDAVHAEDDSQMKEDTVHLH